VNSEQLRGADRELELGKQGVGERFGIALPSLERSDARRGQPSRPELLDAEAVAEQLEHARDAAELDEHTTEVEHDHIERAGRCLRHAALLEQRRRTGSVTTQLLANQRSDGGWRHFGLHHTVH